MAHLKDATPNLMVKNVKETVEFYQQILDFDLVDAVQHDTHWEFAIVCSGNVMFMFQEEVSLKKEYPQLCNFSKGGGLTFYIHVADIEALYKKLESRVTIVKEMHITFYGSKDFAIEDCNGYILTFSQQAEESQIKNYDNFFLPAENLQESRSFYEKMLELPIKFDFSDKGMIAYKIGETEPAIILKDKGRFPDAVPTIWIEVRDVKETYRKLQENGVRFLSEPFQIKTGWAVEFTDPSGNRLGITDYLI
ncbi:MAG: VOC family protein [Candidatus Azobacteroides sp.]|nr:VOC family protein [Candidatus Azobacteroides sp.]